MKHYFIERFQRTKHFITTYERHLSSASLVVGFGIDNLTLQRIDLLFENIILFSYICIAGFSILLFNLHKGGVLRGSFFNSLSTFLPLVIQFAFGGLFSGFVVFYSRSASLFTSLPFLAVLVGILIAGELIRGFYKRLSYQATVFFLALFSFLIFYVPILVKRMNAWVFLLSGILALCIFYILSRVLSRLVPHITSANRVSVQRGVGGVFFLIVLFYFTNILPPIPLSLKDVGVYHNVERTARGYVLKQESLGFFDSLKLYEPVSFTPGSAIYVFSSLFAPTDLKTNIRHVWQYYDEEQGEWMTANTVSFPIRGGSDGGYRGYSLKQNVFPGKWRVQIATMSGQIVGVKKFRVIPGTPKGFEETVSMF